MAKTREGVYILDTMGSTTRLVRPASAYVVFIGAFILMFLFIFPSDINLANPGELLKGAATFLIGFFLMFAKNYTEIDKSRNVVVKRWGFGRFTLNRTKKLESFSKLEIRSRILTGRGHGIVYQVRLIGTENYSVTTWVSYLSRAAAIAQEMSQILGFTIVLDGKSGPEVEEKLFGQPKEFGKGIGTFFIVLGTNFAVVLLAIMLGITYAGSKFKQDMRVGVARFFEEPRNVAVKPGFDFTPAILYDINQQPVVSSDATEGLKIPYDVIMASVIEELRTQFPHMTFQEFDDSWKGIEKYNEGKPAEDQVTGEIRLGLQIFYSNSKLPMVFKPDTYIISPGLGSTTYNLWAQVTAQYSQLNEAGKWDFFSVGPELYRLGIILADKDITSQKFRTPQTLDQLLEAMPILTSFAKWEMGLGDMPQNLKKVITDR